MQPTIANPILRGFNPDPSIVRVGADYYIATSTFEWWPGVQLHHSRDLVHWRLAGHALTRESQLNLRGVADSGGVWAPSLSHADGQFWLIYTNVRTCGMGRPFKDVGIYLATAPEITGPWSEPVALNSIGFDPSLFHDDDGRKWLVNMMWDFRPGRKRFAGIVVQEYDHVQRRLVGPMTRILTKDVLIEGPNLYQRAGWYYLMLAEGGTGWNHGISMARSSAITGPYELDPQSAVLTTRDAPDWPLQKAGHGELVETPSGEWYLAHLASRPVEVGRVVPHAPLSATETRRIKDNPPYQQSERRCILGRETCLQKVVWSADGWLRLDQGGARPPGALSRSENPSARPEVGLHPDVASVNPRDVGTPLAQQKVAAAVTPLVNLGRGHTPGRVTTAVTMLPALAVPAPRGVAPHPWPQVPARDEFAAPRLGAHWSALRGPIEENWASLTARPGWLRVRGRESLHSLFQQSLVAQRLTELRGTAETCLEFAPVRFTQMAGLVCYYDTRTHYYLRVTHDETRGKILGLALTDDGAYAELDESQLVVNDWPRFFLRAEIDRARLQFSASPDGADWRAIGPALDASKLSDDYGAGLHFTGAFVGLCAQDLGGMGAFADFDYFDLASAVEPPSTGEAALSRG